MLLKKRLLLSVFIICTCLSCNNHDSNKIHLKIKNNTKETIIFDKPIVLMNASEFSRKNIFYLNNNMNILRKIEQYDLQHGTKTLYYSLPYVEMISLQPKEKYEKIIEIDIPQFSKENEYIFFMLTECVFHNDYDYYDYIDDMKKSGVFINKKIKGKNITINIKETEFKKMTALAEEDFQSLYDSYNCE